ncbi:MAG: Na+/H+ antiporter NhaC family protein [Myxococcales bacterium]|nr:Na+/H+ antiporter NhaC family protein [Myxococcales bacterium]
MPARSTLVVLALGVLAIIGAALLPIDAASVRRHTADRLTRDALGALVEEPEATRPVRLTVDAPPGERAVIEAAVRRQTFTAGDTRHPLFAVDPAAAETLTLTARDDGPRLAIDATLATAEAHESARLAHWTSLLPPLVALVLAIALRRVALSLFTAVLLGAVLLSDGHPFSALWTELVALVGVVIAPLVRLAVSLGFDAQNPVPIDGYIGKVLADTFNLQILGFTFALVGLVAVVGRMGGTRGLVDALSPLARGPRSAQAVTAAMGTAIFFDDYANTVVIGTTARSLTDRHRISREKLAYIVDSTSAPVAGIAIVSTWIGYEVGLFDALLGAIAGVPDVPSSGYELFFTVLPLRFYCLFALALVFINAATGRDIGPMYHAERRTRLGGPLSAAHGEGEEVDTVMKPGVQPRAINAVVPIGVVLGAVLALILYIGMPDGFDPFSLAGWKQVFDGAGDEIASILLISSLIGSVVAFALAFAQRLLTPREAVAAYGRGAWTLLETAAILIGAWAIKSVCDDLGTGLAIVAIIGDALPPIAIPITVFVISGLVAFSTGTSWGTMALVLPIAAPLAATLSGDPLIVFASLGAVLDGAIWGDHCSPISDTTVLSSTASACPHLDHVRTQLPYAMLAMLAAGGVGYFGIAAGLPLWLAYVLGLALLTGVIVLLGRDPGAAES